MLANINTCDEYKIYRIQIQDEKSAGANLEHQLLAYRYVDKLSFCAVHINGYSYLLQIRIQL